MVFTLVSLLNSWEAAGVFDYVLPFLLVFAVIFGILSTTNILGKNKGVHTIIALVIGLLAIRLELVPMFFRELFPQVGVGLAILVSVLILTGLFVVDEERRYWYWGFGLIAVVIALIVVVNSFDNLGLTFLVAWNDYLGIIIGALFVIGVVIAVVASKSEGPTSHKATFTQHRSN